MSEPGSPLWDWLSVLRLEQYAAAFRSAGLASPRRCRNLTAAQLEAMGVTLPGHQRRILASLKERETGGGETLRPVAREREREEPEPEARERQAPQMKEERGEGGDKKREKPLPGLRRMASGEEERDGEGGEKKREKPLPGLRRMASGEEERDGEGGEKKPLPGQRTRGGREEERDGEGGEKKPLPGQRTRGGREEEREGEREKPVPKERTRFRPSAPVHSGCLPPVPPRSVPNCPPQRFTASPPTSPPTHAPLHPPTLLPLQPPVRHAAGDGGGASASVSHGNDVNAPPLPPKSGAWPKGRPPIPHRVCVLPPSGHDGELHRFTLLLGLFIYISSPTRTVPGELQRALAPQLPPRCRGDARLSRPPARRLTRLSRDAKSLDDSDDYEEPELFYPGVNDPDRDMSLEVPLRLKGRYSSLCSDDEQLDDEDEEGVYLPTRGRLSSTSKEDDAQLAAVIKMGWLDKNPPQGALYYQRRWVKLDVDYLRYFDSDKAVYSKGIISMAFVTNVTSVGELKFEVVTNNRTFIFRAESEAERNSWVSVLQDSTRGRHLRSGAVSSTTPSRDFQGYLELRGLRPKLYTVVASDKVFLYKNIEDYRIGVGITSIEMNVGNVKEADRRGFDLTTPYRIFSFVCESEPLREQWVGAMRDAIDEALSNSEVAERIWAEPSNSLCADCQAPQPEWAAINLCVVVCKRCAGEHRGLGPSISKVRSLKMDRKVWTEELIQVFLLLGNKRVNSFWAANVPPSEALMAASGSEDRRRFIANKYRQGKYRKYHPLYGNQEELNNALCVNVQGGDVLETLRLLFCGAEVNCCSGMESWPTALSLANAHTQPLQAELLSLNLNTELPRSELPEVPMEPLHYSAPPCVSHNGFLFKTASMARAVVERKAREEFSRRWCTVSDGSFSYYESDKNSNPNGALRANEIVCLAVDSPERHGYDHTFELYSESERLYLFGTDDPDSHKEWVKSIAMSFIPAAAEPLLKLSFERIGRLRCKDGLNLQTSKVGWFALVGSTLHAHLEDSQVEQIQLRKLNELSIQQDNEVLVLVERGRTLYIEGERKLDFSGWCAAIQAAAGSGGDTLSQQQLTDTDIPVIVHSCIGYITQCGLTSEGIYRKSGVNSRVKALSDRFRLDARSLHLREGEQQVDDVSSALKRFFRELDEGLFTAGAAGWLSATDIRDESQKISQFQLLLNRLPCVNKATLQALINHLYCVQRFSELNQMNLHNLAIVFGPTLFQSDGKDVNASRAIEDLIQHYTSIFQVDEQQLQKQLKEITVIIKVRESHNTKFPSTEPGGHFICTVYLEEKKDTAEQHVKIPGSMTAAELTCEILDRRNIQVQGNEYWNCWEVSDKEEMERPLHHQERVLPVLHSIGTESHLLIKKHLAMAAMMLYLAGQADASKHGVVKLGEERSLLALGRSSGIFHDRYAVLNAESLRMYKDVRSNCPERDWPVKNLKVYMGIKKKVRPPTSWGLTVVYESKKQEKQKRHQWYLCCDSESEMREWYATFLSIQHDGDVWPQDGVQHTRVLSRVLPAARHGKASLIPLRGSENEMRNSVAAFSQDALALFRDVR
ncbi:arf-GAP with Rho-GAP domain, ANK repeat and PH domain-containing protein 1-like isoform X2 [Pseudoliparis swirei]|uniref:arf-GAP with Rho-GAP domain, ANK repeat and PH domain-containing protein 1-like isoform X2 n=1 Tax=Pseudoliparis swirei TaxID=2059687 RepID=UPI0024BEC0FB|nr:arf-GAP with Rho-GAP domain, ANK repeat and PH domain-containing protein 1-like isoform X2 [Pseudoliparis swirei]